MLTSERYSRQTLFSGIGIAGQEKIAKAKVLIVGMGALGTVIANNLCRSGVGMLRMVDRDYVEISNLQRQTLFEETDVQQHLPKSTAAATHLQKINYQVILEPIVDDLNYSNIARYTDGIDIILDGTDNFETRFLINDYCVQNHLPWVYGAVSGSYGMTMNIIPGETPCLRCFMQDIPSPGMGANCSSAGVINMITGIIGCHQSVEALKYLVSSPVRNTILYIDLWNNVNNPIHVLKEPNCRACTKQQYDFLRPQSSTAVTTMCGSNSYQVIPPHKKNISFEIIGNKLSQLGQVSINKYLLSFKTGETEITLFPDGRAIIKNAADEGAAKSIYTEYIGL